MLKSVKIRECILKQYLVNATLPYRKVGIEMITLKNTQQMTIFYLNVLESESDVTNCELCL